MHREERREGARTLGAPVGTADALTGNNSWSRKIDYNGFNLVSQVTDARGVATNFSYDTLNRLIWK